MAVTPIPSPVGLTLSALAGVAQGTGTAIQASKLYTKDDAARKAELERKLQAGKALSRGTREAILTQGQRDQSSVLRALGDQQPGGGLTGATAGAAQAQALAAREQAAGQIAQRTSQTLAEARATAEDAARQEVRQLRADQQARKQGITQGIVQAVSGGLAGSAKVVDAAQQRKAAAELAQQQLYSDIKSQYLDDPVGRSQVNALLAELEKTDPAKAAQIRTSLGG